MLFREKMCREERKLAEALKREEAKSMLENAAWFERERLAQEEFRNKREVEDRKRKEREEREVRAWCVGWTVSMLVVVSSAPDS